MAYLNWSSAPAAVTVDPSREEKIGVRIAGLTAEDRSELATAVAAVNRQEDPELRIDFPNHFTLFIKSRSDVSRFLVAHPEPEAWVGTIALSLAHGDAFSDRLLAGWTEELSVNRLSKVDRWSNLELTLAP